MKTVEEIKTDLKQNLLPKRYNHSIGVADEAKRLASLYGADLEKAYIAGLSHDCAKNFDEEKQRELYDKYGVEPEKRVLEQKLVHSDLGSLYAKYEYGINDEEILSAIKYHTTAKADMTLMEKIIYIADFTEPNRTFPDVDILREKVDKDIDDGILYALDFTIKKLVDSGKIISKETFEARNFLLKEKNLCQKNS